jgi:HAMP domain-containing protein
VVRIMKLMIKFNLVFVGVFLVGLLVAGRVSYSLLQNNGRDEILQNARIMMESMLAQRSYTNQQIKPLLETQMKYTFLPQSVPAYAATEAFNALREKHPEYSYKEATLNPSNPRDRANDWEADIVGKFRQDPSMSEIVGERDTPTGRSLYLSRPIQIKSQGCLVCHSTIEAAPKPMLDRYGTANGFGWQMGEIIGAQIVSVPTAVPFNRANQAFKIFMLSLTGVFLFIFVALNLMLSSIVIRPVTRLATLADQVSLGKIDGVEFLMKSKDEIGALSSAFGRMQKSLQRAIKMLEE